MIPVQKQIERIPAAVMDVLATHCWPGNIRELQNFIERSVIFTPGNTLRPPLDRPRPAAQAAPQEQPITLEDTERDLICRTLKQMNGIIDGSERCRCSAGSETYYTLLPHAETGNFAQKKMNGRALLIIIRVSDGFLPNENPSPTTGILHTNTESHALQSIIRVQFSVRPGSTLVTQGPKRRKNRRLRLSVSQSH